MKKSTRLTCYGVGCNGRFEYVGDRQAETALYRCEACGKELQRSGVKQLAAQDDGPISQLATLLLEGRAES